jgi:hypothetical protein
MNSQTKYLTHDENTSNDKHYDCFYSKNDYNIVFALKNNLISVKLTKNDTIYKTTIKNDDFTCYFLFDYGSNNSNTLYEMICESAASNEEIKSISIHEYEHENFIRINFNEKQFYQNFQITVNKF